MARCILPEKLLLDLKSNSSWQNVFHWACLLVKPGVWLLFCGCCGMSVTTQLFKQSVDHVWYTCLSICPLFETDMFLLGGVGVGVDTKSLSPQSGNWGDNLGFKLTRFSQMKSD